MHPATGSALVDEFSKIASTWDRQADWAKLDRETEAGKTIGQKARKAAGEMASKAHGAFLRMGPVGQSAVMSGAIGGAFGGARGFMRNDPVYKQDGTVRYPHIGDRIVRTGTGALGGGLTSAALGGGAVHLLRKALHP